MVSRFQGSSEGSVVAQARGGEGPGEERFWRGLMDRLEGEHRVDRWALVSPRELVPEPRVRALCAEDLCGAYGRFPFCPPEVGSLAETGPLLRSFAGCLAVQATFDVDPRDRVAVRQTRRAFQETTLALEALASDALGLDALGSDALVPEGSSLEAMASERMAHPGEARGEGAASRAPTRVWSLPGGTCALCDPCPLANGEACPRPGEAHPSLEALGVDVVGLGERLGWDAAFHPDRVSWTGALLWGRAAPGALGRGLEEGAA